MSRFKKKEKLTVPLDLSKLREVYDKNVDADNGNIDGMSSIEQLAEIAQNDSFNATQTADSAKAESTQAAQNASAALRYNMGKWLAPVATFDDIATTSPDPEENDRVQVRDTGRAYVRLNNAWEWFSEITAGPVNELDNRVTDQITRLAVDVTSKGASGDGATDDTVAVQAAFDAMKPGGTLLFPNGGSFNITSPIVVNKECTISAGKSLLKSFGNALFLIEADNVTITGIDFDNDINNYLQHSSLIKVTGNNFSFNNNRIRGLQHSGLRLETAENVRVFNNDFKDCAYMVYCEDTKNVAIQNNYFTGGRVHHSTGQTTVGDGIKLTGLYNENILISDNVFEDVYRDAVDAFRGGSNVVIADNIMLNIHTLGLDIKTIYRDPSDPNGTTIEENKTKDYTITGNRFYNCGFNSEGAAIAVSHSEYRSGETLQVSRGVENILIANNYIDTTSRYGVVLQGCSGILLNNNHFKNVVSRSINLLSICKNIKVDGNIIDSTGSNDVVISTSNQCEDVQIQNNFLIRNDEPSPASVGIFVEGVNIIVSGNRINKAISGIRSATGSRHFISDNSISFCTTAGIETGSSTSSPTESFYSGNMIQDSQRGFFFRSSTGKKMVVMNNVCYNCSNTYSNSSTIDADKFINNIAVV